MELAEKSPPKGIKLFGRYLNPNKENLAQCALLILVVLPTSLLGIYLSFTAIGQALEFYTGLNAILAFIGSVALGMAIGAIKPKAVFSKISTYLWILLQLVSIYWVFKYSSWSDLKSITYLILTLLLYANNLINKNIPD